MNSLLLQLKNYIKTNEVNKTRDILNQHPDFLHEEFRIGTLLHIAISSNSLEVATTLIDEYNVSPHIIGKRWQHSILYDAVMTEKLETCQYVINKGVTLDVDSFCLFINQTFNEQLLDTVISQSDQNLYEYIHIAKINNRTDLVNYLYKLKSNEEEDYSFSDEEDINWSTSNLQIESGKYMISKEIKTSTYIKCDDDVLLESKNKDGIFQIINGAKLTIENATIKSNHEFTFAILNGELHLINCEIICNQQAIYIENGIATIEHSNISQKTSTGQITSVICADKSKLYLKYVEVDADKSFLYSNNDCEILIENCSLKGNSKQFIYGENNISINIIDSTFHDYYALTHLKDNVEINIKNSKLNKIKNGINLEKKGQVTIQNSSFNNISNGVHVGKNSIVLIENSMFINAHDQVARIDESSELTVNNTSFNNIALHALSGIDKSEIFFNNSVITNALGGIITQGGKINVANSKFIGIKGEGAVRGINNDKISISNVIIDSSLTDIIVDKPRKLVQENVAITNPVTIDDLI
ncbi:right-handed parallel beta-helix repeat-containing protein [Macrococcus capreoli]